VQIECRDQSIYHPSKRTVGNSTRSTSSYWLLSWILKPMFRGWKRAIVRVWVVSTDSCQSHTMLVELNQSQLFGYSSYKSYGLSMIIFCSGKKTMARYVKNWMCWSYPDQIPIREQTCKHVNGEKELILLIDGWVSLIYGWFSLLDTHTWDQWRPIFLTTDVNIQPFYMGLNTPWVLTIQF